MIVDVNVHLGRWPCRRLRGDEPGELVSMLRRQRVRSAWAGSFDALLHRDLAAVNQRLADDCRRFGNGLLAPFGAVDPQTSYWEDELRRCHEVHQMPGIRLYPAWHGYGLDLPALQSLLNAAAARGLVVQIALTLEDQRTRHPLLNVPPVDLAPLAGLVRKVPAVRLVLLNVPGSVAREGLREIVQAGQVYLDIANLEGVAGVAGLLEHIPAERILFGSHAPFFYHEAAVLKLRESRLPQDQDQAIRERNAERLLEQARLR